MTLVRGMLVVLVSLWMLGVLSTKFSTFSPCFGAMMFLPFVSRESDDNFEELQEVLYLRAALINHWMFMEFRDIPEAERLAEVERLTGVLVEMSH